MGKIKIQIPNNTLLFPTFPTLFVLNNSLCSC